jgi:glucosamine--fructose-6-phosphate aminotransferase (isomerizing)
MCGIIGYVGPRDAAPVLLDSLKRLEYRGYDSAGIAVVDGAAGGTATLVKTERKVADLAAHIELEGVPRGHLGIGHTRWATHGRPTLINAHPHADCHGNIHLIHNGIIENYRELRAELSAQGHEFTSDTDTEVVPHLIEQLYEGDLADAVRRALARIRGAYALVVVSNNEPDRIVGARMNAPLVVGLGDGEVFISSDITALIPYTKRCVLIGEGEVVSASVGSVDVTAIDGSKVKPKIIHVDWEAEQAQKGGYPHFMLKEIHEQPDAVRNALRDRIDDSGLVRLPGLDITPLQLAEFDAITIVACGTAWIAGLIAKYALEKVARIRVDVEAASEFRYRDPIVNERTLVIAISQSGETADTIAAVRGAKEAGATVLAITNVLGSALSLEADGVVYMQSGPEICVAATKTFLAQIVCGLLLALHIGRVRGILGDDEHRRLTGELLDVPEKILDVLQLDLQIVDIAQRYAHARNALFIGRGVNYAVALEGALKLKEVSYVHAEGYAAGELKHGPIALLDPEVPVVALATEGVTLAKVVSNVEEVRSREAPIIAVVTRGRNPFDEKQSAEDIIAVPSCDELVSPLINVVPLQLLAYHVAVERGCDVDQPRNLAKSVTVE